MFRYSFGTYYLDVSGLTFPLFGSRLKQLSRPEVPDSCRGLPLCVEVSGFLEWDPGRSVRSEVAAISNHPANTGVPLLVGVLLLLASFASLIGGGGLLLLSPHPVLGVGFLVFGAVLFLAFGFAWCVIKEVHLDWEAGVLRVRSGKIVRERPLAEVQAVQISTNTNTDYQRQDDGGYWYVTTYSFTVALQLADGLFPILWARLVEAPPFLVGDQGTGWAIRRAAEQLAQSLRVKVIEEERRRESN